MDIDVDTGRLSQEAGTLSAQRPGLGQVKDDLDTATATAIAGCGSVADGGLRAALRNLSDSWGFDIEAVGSDVGGIAGVMNTLARLYSQVDASGAQELNG